MTQNDLILLRRKEMVGMVTAIAWGLGLLLIVVEPLTGLGDLGVCGIVVGWIFAAYWVALDSRYRNARVFWWTAFALVAGPMALLFYFVSRVPAPAFCSACGASLTSPAHVCPVCGRQTSVLNRIFSALTQSLAPGPLERAKHTAKYMAMSLAALVFFGLLLAQAMPYSTRGLLAVVWTLSAAAYWVLVPWWVYLDAMWRKMDAVPWALLTLLTNVFGLVTYLVIRYPDPRSCPQCGAYLTMELKRCPYCGSEAEPTCPRCQSSVKADWVYCPACAAQLPVPTQTGPAQDDIGSVAASPSVSIAGTVVDAHTGLPLAEAEVKVDSKIEAPKVTTDESGRFLLSGLEPGPYVLVASAEGHIAQAKGYTPTAAGAGQVHFMLLPAHIPAATASPAGDGDIPTSEQD